MYSKEDTVLSERKDCAPKVKERFVNWILKSAFKRNSNNVKDERMRVQQVDLQLVLVLCSLELQKLPYSIGHTAAWENCQNYVDLDIVIEFPPNKKKHT